MRHSWWVEDEDPAPVGLCWWAFISRGVRRGGSCLGLRVLRGSPEALFLLLHATLLRARRSARVESDAPRRRGPLRVLILAVRLLYIESVTVRTATARRSSLADRCPPPEGRRSLKQSRRYDFRARAEGRCRRWLKGVEALSAAASLPEAAVELGHGLL